MNRTTHNIRVTSIDCILYRVIGFILFVTSLINIVVICRYFIKQYYHRKKHVAANRLSPIMIGMLISSAIGIVFGLPIVIIQCFSCQAYLLNEYACQLHGFICFTTGLFNMYLVALLSFLRYLSILHKSNSFNKFLEHRRNLSTLLCAITSIGWSLPPLFKIGNKYIPEGAGFYCSLEWNDPSLQSRVYLLCVVFFNYVIPFCLILYTNLRVWYTLRCLLKSCHTLTRTSLPFNSSIADTKMISLSYDNDNQTLTIDLQKALIDTQFKETINRLQRLNIDRRYAYMTAMIAAQYFLVWTPYASVAILEFLNRTTFIQQHPFWPTLFALLAKLSFILNPLILIYTSTIAHS